MTPGMRALLGLVAVGILIIAWITRLDVKAVPSGVVVHNRWTGTVYNCDLAGCIVIYPK
jgi:hypothetical protein